MRLRPIGFGRLKRRRLLGVGLRVALTVAALAAVLPRLALAVVSSNVDPDSIFNGVNINQLVGAETFYLNGYWGSRAVIANVEAGHVWNGHMTLHQVTNYINDPSIAGTTRQYDFHATAVGHVLVGQADLNVSLGEGITYTISAPESYYYTATDADGIVFNWSAFTGMAPTATLWSAAVATSFQSNGSFEINDTTLAYAYRTVMRPGAYSAGRKADVVNSSWGFEDPSGSDGATQLIDALAYANGTTVCLAAGNHETTPQPVGGPASGYNSISVAALASDTSTPVYVSPASFSNAGPNSFYNPKTGVTVPNARATVDLAAPGDNLTLAYYGGATGSNTGGADSTKGSPYYFLVDAGGTSFASPIVAGGAALLVDVGRDRYAGNAAAIDGRVVKAVLMNSAAKTAGWSNGQTTVAGRVTTTQSLDYAVGAGALDLANAYTQYTTGTADVAGLGGGNVATTGWDYGRVAAGSPNDYFLAPVGPHSRLTVTLDWFVNRSFDELTLATADVQMGNLDLEVWSVLNGALDQKVGESVSLYNNAEHLSFNLPEGQYYALRVLWAGETYDVPGNTPDVESYGLAWQVSTVPEPSSIMLVLLALAGGTLWRWRALGRQQHEPSREVMSA